jgi:hypothetical protein
MNRETVEYLTEVFVDIVNKNKPEGLDVKVKYRIETNKRFYYSLTIVYSKGDTTVEKPIITVEHNFDDFTPKEFQLFEDEFFGDVFHELISIFIYGRVWLNIKQVINGNAPLSIDNNDKPIELLKDDTCMIVLRPKGI